MLCCSHVLVEASTSTWFMYFADGVGKQPSSWSGRLRPGLVSESGIHFLTCGLAKEGGDADNGRLKEGSGVGMCIGYSC